MLNQVHRGFIRLVIPLLLVALGCSLSPELALPVVEPDYRYDDLPSPANESALIEEYRAISRWSTVDPGGRQRRALSHRSPLVPKRRRVFAKLASIF